MSKLTLSQLVFGTAVDDLKNFLLDTDLAGAFRIRRKSDGSGATLANFNSSGVLEVPAGVTVGGATTMRRLATAEKALTGTFVEFGPATSDGIPAWATTIKVRFSNCSTSGLSEWLVRMGLAGVENTGYQSTSTYSNSGSASVSSVTGFIINRSTIADQTANVNAVMTLEKLPTGDVWLETHVGSIIFGGAAPCLTGGGRKDFAAHPDTLRFTTVNGTDTGDSGSISLVYEG